GVRAADASMGPRPIGRGEAAGVGPVPPTPFQLQWGPRPIGRGERARQGPVRQLYASFNGAATNRSRRGATVWDIDILRHGFNGAATNRSRRGLLCERCGHAWQQSFNGAATNRSRRAKGG